MDKSDTMFDHDHPPVPNNNKANLNVWNYNTILDFDAYGIYCGKLNFTYKDFYEVMLTNASDECLLANGETLILYEIWDDLLINYSFNMSYKLDEY